MLYAAGVRFCYDREALQAGVPWDEDVLNYIRNPRCSGVIFFLSRDLFASRSIQTEIEIATDLHGTGGGAKSYFCVNLTQQRPSRILMSLGALSDEELERYGLDTERIALLARTFSDRATYLSFDSPNHARELIDVIRDQFNVMPGACFEFPEGVYEGALHAGKRSGQGRFTFLSGDIYEGEWQDDKRCGEGTMTFANGNRYTGSWSDNKCNGTGTMYYSDGTVYEGEWRDNLPNGQGIRHWADGTVYEGQWHDGVREGFGKERDTDGDTYEGDWKDGKRDGQGVFCCTNGERYEGQWRAGWRNGFGKMHFADGADHEGEWKDGKQNGHGILCVSQEYRYIDPLAKPEYDEQGQVYRASYEGEFRNGILSGPCCLTIPGVMKALGRWEDGIPAGNVRIFYDGGDAYEGEQVNLLPHGKGLFITSDHNWILGSFERGKLVEGQFVEPNANLLLKDEALQEKVKDTTLLDDLAKRGGRL